MSFAMYTGILMLIGLGNYAFLKAFEAFVKGDKDGRKETKKRP